VLEDYLGKAAADIAWQTDRFIVTLRGAPTWPFQRVGPATDAQRGSWPELATEPDGSPRPRWFEVPIGDDNIDVITRDSDDYTNVVATGFARLVARAWHGEVET
jgi:hypothetical protein